jgi:glycosyltransferase involved in cell wall biosynthesis
MAETPMPQGALLSALVVARNEESQLAQCLESVRFADEIVVVLDRSSDGSRAIAQAAGARLIEGAWPLEGPRRHAGIEACHGPWILEVDADERVPQTLATEIRAALTRDTEPGAFLISFDNYIGQHRVRYGWGAYNGVAAKYCLFSKGAKQWGEARVHPPITLSGKRRALAAHMTHFVDRDFSELFARLNRYTDYHARDLAERGEAPGGWKSARRVLSRFWKSYVARKGYREGFYGVALALFSGLYPLFLYLKARELLAARQEAS